VGRASNRKAQRAQLHQTEGTLKVSFVFDGKERSYVHQFKAEELRHMKELCATHGDAAADQVVWKMAVRYGGYFAENALARAALDYIAKHYKGERKVNPNVLQMNYADLELQIISSLPDDAAKALEDHLNGTTEVDL
jgi:hypothetical protein